MRRRSRFAFTVAAIVATVTSIVPGQTVQMPVAEIRPGMIGVGHTVFDGDTREEFSAQILGVLENVLGPRRSLILARLEGGPLAETGVIAGMSGSPVYIDGRLVGAVSYSLGSFSKEAIAGITPIAEMIEAASLPPRRAAGSLDLDPSASPEELRAALTRLAWPDGPTLSAHKGMAAMGLPTGLGDQRASTLRPIATPLVLSGFGREARELLTDIFDGRGFLPMVGGGRAPAPAADDEPLQPGDPVGVSLVRGDLEVGATGTVTHVDGDRVYAFGHPFLNLGPTTFPMTRAYVYTLLPSLMASSKIAGLGESIGTFQQDRATAISGTLGDVPALIPLSLRLNSDRGSSQNFEFGIVNDQMLTPVLAYVSILNTLLSYERQTGGGTFEVTGHATVKGHGEVAFENLFTGDSPSMGAASYVATPITFLMTNDLEPIELASIDIEITSSEEPRSASLERVWLDAVQVKPGRTVPLKILMRSYRGEESIHTVPIEIPANATDRVSILVSDGARLTQRERQERRLATDPTSLAQMIRTLNNHRKNNRLYIKLLSQEKGAVVGGEALSALPPSVLAVYNGDRSSGEIIPLASATIGDWELTVDHAVSGSRLLTVNLDSR